MLLGYCYLGGWGVNENAAAGMAYLVSGAERGSGFGCSLMGHNFAKGEYGLPKDAKQATIWYRKMQACTTGTVSAQPSAKQEAAAWLREHATD